MAVAVGVLSDTRRRTLEAVCDTFVPSIAVDDCGPVLRDFYARSASDLGVCAQIEGLLGQGMMPQEIEALGQLLDAFAEHGTPRAHQMGSCRMGSDPTDSVADGRGELHDTKGVWIGDGSALPTAPGVNPMISIMSLAHRTAANMLATT
jgi:choline dehydrogenase-like flavoprotein